MAKKYHKLPHVLSILTFITTFFLISIGGIVTSTNSGMAVPDWPTTFGHNMFLYPLSKTISGYIASIDAGLQADLDNSKLTPSLQDAIESEDNHISLSTISKIEVIETGKLWRINDSENHRTFTIKKAKNELQVYIQGVFAEHSHRLMGTIVGLLTLSLSISIWKFDQRKWMKWLSSAVLCAVLVQGILGGLRVTEISVILAIIHACLAQAFLALCCGVMMFTSREWTEWHHNKVEEADLLRHLSIFTTGGVYFQIVWGAILRHTASQLQTHIFFAILITYCVLRIISRVFINHRNFTKFTVPALFLGVSLILQIVLGIGAWLSEFQLGNNLTSLTRTAITTGHLVIGALMLVTSVFLTLRVFLHSSALEGYSPSSTGKIPA
ncbi:hypothetical protein CMK22_17975 [Candidatus Poribacteria bacterium]|nr:hypothetical protein [Candidatus Poribacteria bacterium]